MSPPVSPQEDDEFTPSYINKDGRFRIPPALMREIGWEAEPSQLATFELVEGGVVRLRPGTFYDEAFSKVATDPVAVNSLRRTLRRGSWEGKNRLNPPPESVRAHVLETGELHGLMYVRIVDGLFEIVGHAWRMRLLEADREAASDAL